MSLQTSQVIVLVRILTLDRDTTVANRNFSDAQIAARLNDKLEQFKALRRERIWTVAGNSNGLTLAAGDKVATMSGVAGTAELYSVHRQLVAADTDGLRLERKSYGEIRYLQSNQPTQGAPTAAAWYLQEQGFPTNEATWIVHPWPIPDGTYYLSTRARREGPELSTVTLTNRLDLSRAEARIVGRLTAADIAQTLGFSESRIGRILRPVPDDIREAFGVAARQRTPQQDRSQVPA